MLRTGFELADADESMPSRQSDEISRTRALR